MLTNLTHYSPFLKVLLTRSPTTKVDKDPTVTVVEAVVVAATTRTTTGRSSARTLSNMVSRFYH